MASMGASVSNFTDNWKQALTRPSFTNGRDLAVDPAKLNWFSTNQELAERAKVNLPKPTPVQEMPVPGDAASMSAKRNKEAAMQARGGRASTIMTGSRLGD